MCELKTCISLGFRFTKYCLLEWKLFEVEFRVNDIVLTTKNFGEELNMF